jgi:CspA family cold shock protein
MRNGTVKWFNKAKGFGFITPEDGTADVFCHYSVIEGTGYRSLREGERVEFDSQHGSKGEQATKVVQL